MIFSAAFNSVWIVFGLVAVNLVARRAWITAIVMVLFLMLTGLGNISDTPPVWLGLLVGAFTVSAIVFVMLRFGLLATLTFFLANFLLSSDRSHARRRQVVLSNVDDDAADRVGAGVLRLLRLARRRTAPRAPAAGLSGVTDRATNCGCERPDAKRGF